MSTSKAFKILIGKPDDTPSTFGTTQLLLPPGKEHNLLVTPTFIRSILLESFNVFFFLFLVLILASLIMQLRRDIVCSLKIINWTSLKTTLSVTVFWNVTSRRLLTWSNASLGSFPGLLHLK